MTKKDRAEALALAKKKALALEKKERKARLVFEKVLKKLTPYKPELEMLYFKNP